MRDTPAFERLPRAFARFAGYNVAYARQGNGPPVLLVHGLGGTADFWHPLVDHLAPTHTVICADLIGFGFSDKPRIDYTLGQHVGALAAAVQAAGVDRLHAVVGHSLGGVIATALAASGLVAVERLGLAAAPYPTRRYEVRHELIQIPYFNLLLRYRWLARVDHSVWTLLWPLLRRRAVPEHLRGGWAGFLDYTADSYYSTAEECLFRANLDPLLPRLAGRPALLLYGEDDRTVPFVHGQRLRTALPQSTFVRVAGGHYAVLQAGAAPLAAWLQTSTHQAVG